MVRGSLPNFSLVAPEGVDASPGTVTGMGTEQVLPLALTVTPVMNFAGVPTVDLPSVMV